MVLVLARQTINFRQYFAWLCATQKSTLLLVVRKCVTRQPPHNSKRQQTKAPTNCHISRPRRSQEIVRRDDKFRHLIEYSTKNVADESTLLLAARPSPRQLGNLKV
jgi:hypothetical protein